MVTPTTDMPKEPPSLKVVVAEDNPVNAKLIKAVLGRMGLEPVIAENGQLLLEAMREASFDLVLMDISMPVMDGYDATLAIRSGSAGTQHQNVLIIAVTALETSDTLQTCIDVGMNGLLGKPISADRLRAAIERAQRGELLESQH
ncbi:MAG: response regulator [Opitutales bacterium]